ncbi:IS66 family insertion sequence element accessory protein TnpA [Nitrobacter sp. TKz-YC02]
MTSEHRGCRRQGEDFWRAHHEAWTRSDLNQRQYCEAQGIPLKAFGNWRSLFKVEPQPPKRKLLYRRRSLSPPLSPPLSPLVSPGSYPSSAAAEPIVPRPREGHRRRFAELYVIEAAIRGQTAEARQSMRRSKSLPLVTAMKAWLEM